MASLALSSRGPILFKLFHGLQLQTSSSCTSTLRSLSLPFRVTALHTTTHHEKLQAALNVVQRACRLCLSVQSRMSQGTNQLDKFDNTPVTVADFGVQALVSLELSRFFPNIPLVGEENASQLRADYEQKLASGDHGASSLIETIVEALSPVTSENVDCETVLDAIDRGAKRTEEKSYWILDPIDGTRGFLRGGNALYVVGLALVVDGEPVVGVMGCPNVAIEYCSDGSSVRMASAYFDVERKWDCETYDRGLVMAACLGGGCWVKPLSRISPSNGLGSESEVVGSDSASSDLELKTEVVRPDSGSIDLGFKTEVSRPDAIADSWFCISDNELWSRTLLSNALASSSLGMELNKDEMQVLPLCCGSLCKYFALALGGVSAFLLQAGRSTPLKVWDHAAGVICVSEAGGRVSDLEGTGLETLIGNGREVFTAEGGGVLASNTVFHDLLLPGFRNQNGAVG